MAREKKFIEGLILNFSPRKNGNCSFVANLIFERLKKSLVIKKVDVHNLMILPCRSCNYCFLTGKCKIKDEMNILYQYFESSDLIVIVTPVYFYHLPGYAKMIIDRCQPYWVKKYVLKQWNIKQKIGSIIVIGATKGKQLFTGINLTVKYFFDIINCKFDKETNLYIKNVDLKNDIVKYKESITSHIVKLLKCYNS